MGEVKWIKIVTDIFDDEKILLIESMPEADSVIVIWFKLLCMAGKQNNGGVFMLNDKIAYTDEMLSTIFRRPVNTVRLALKTFESFGMVEIVNDVVTIPNWEKHQSLDKLEESKRKTRERVAAHRARQKAIVSGEPCNGYINDTVTQCNTTDIEEDKDKDKEKELEGDREFLPEPQAATKKTTRFTPPALSEIAEYCRERQNNVDPERFFDYYTANGWQVGKNKMKDWKAAVRTWEKTSYNSPKQQRPQTSGNPFLDMMQEEYQ